jgi:hypothetical protein
MQKLLFLTAFPPNCRSGGQVFSLNVIQELAQRYEVDVVYFEYPNHICDKKIYDISKSVKSYPIRMRNIFNHLFIHPMFTRRFDKNILEYLKKVASEYSILFFDYSQTGLYACYLDHPYKIIRMHDVLYQKYLRKNAILAFWIKTTEYKIMKNVQRTFVPSKKDSDIIKDVYKLDVLYAYDKIKNFNFSKFSKELNRFIFYGLWSRNENLKGLIWFIKKVYPLIEKDLGIDFTIIGSGLSERIERKYIASNSGINYWGFVDDPLEIIYKSRAVIAPLFAGAGVKIKVIDAFTTGTPVIGTDLAFEGLPVVKNLVYLAKKPKEYANFINNFQEISYREKQKNAHMFRLMYGKNYLLEQI